MKEILQQVKQELEKAYSNPGSHDLESSIRMLQEARETQGDKGTMIENAIRALEQAKNARPALQIAGDISSSAAFGQAYNALEHAIESYADYNNDPYQS